MTMLASLSPLLAATSPAPAPADQAALLGRPLGPHLTLGGGLLKAAERARFIGATAVQIFADNPIAWRRRAEPPRELPAFRERLAMHNIGFVAVHAPYLINLAASDPGMWARSVKVLESELRMAQAYGAHAVNVHVGSHVGQGVERGIAQIAEGLSAVLAEVGPGPDSPLIVLENSAGQGDGLGSSIEELAAILEAAARAGADLQRIGICLDTAHLWGSGYDLDDPDAFDALLVRVDAELGPERLRMIHLNDSRAAKGSRQDRHEHIGAGRIGRSGLRNLLTHPRLARVPTYLETPGMDSGYDAVNMERVRRLIADEPLAELPPEAFRGGGARSRTIPVEPSDSGERGSFEDA
jgi:deoxyribonuclease-4